MYKIDLIDLSVRGGKNEIAAFLLQTKSESILFDCGPESQFSKLSLGLAKFGLKPKDISRVFPSHIHLDHAGAAWRLAEEGAVIYLHPFGAKHFKDPSKLYASAKMIYTDQMDELWGSLLPIAAEKIVEVADNDVIELDGLKIIAHYTPGHAKHHIVWQVENSFFTGDLFGCKAGDGIAIAPTPPPDIDYELWRSSIARIVSQNPKDLYFTHFGRHSYSPEIVNNLEQTIIFAEKIGQELLSRGTKLSDLNFHAPEDIRQQYRKIFRNEEEFVVYDKMSPTWMNCQGALFNAMRQGRNKA